MPIHISRVDDPVGEPPRRPLHDVVGRRVDAHRQRRRGVGEQVDPEDLRGEQRHRDRLARVVEAEHAGEHDAEEHRQHLADVRREQEAQELADVREDPAALAHGGDDRGEVVVGEDHVRRLLASRRFR